MAENDGKIYITISDRRFGSNKAEADEQNQLDKQKNEQKQGGSLLGQYVQHEIFHLIRNTANQAVNMTVSNIGNLTGNYIQQRTVNEQRQMLSNTMAIVFSTIAGAKYAGAAGAAAGFIFGTTTILLGGFFEVQQKTIDNKLTNYQLNKMRERVGLNTRYDGSRGTEN